MAVLEDLERFGNEGAASSGGQGTQNDPTNHSFISEQPSHLPAPTCSTEHRPYDESSRFNDQDKGGDRLSTGQPWATMARIVRDVDEQKIKHYKEDIDSILVFVRMIIFFQSPYYISSYKSERLAFSPQS